jgi:hypothetical protein
MCKIDAAYAAISIDEKKDPRERFIQALDESGTHGKLRELLLKHFSDNWLAHLGTIESIEQVLQAQTGTEDQKDKLISFILMQPIYALSRTLFNDDASQVERNPSLMFIRDVIRYLSNDSPLEFFDSELPNAMKGIPKTKLLRFAFGKDYINDNFFNAESLKKLSINERTEKLWYFFCETTNSTKGYKDWSGSQLSISHEELFALIDSPNCEPTSQTQRLLKGFEFLKRWMEYDAKSGIFHHRQGRFFKIFEIMLGNLNSLAKDDARVKQWTRDFEKEIQLTFLSHFDLSKATDKDKQLWATQMQYHFSYFTYLDADRFLFTGSQWTYFNELLVKLTPEQRGVWLQLSIDTFFTDFFEFSKERPNGEYSVYSIWCFGNTYSEWKHQFLTTLQGLSIEQQLNVLSKSCLGPQTPTPVEQNEFGAEHKAWWNSLFFDLRKKADFPKSLLPQFIRRVIDLERPLSPKTLSDIENCIGYLRGVVHKSCATEPPSQEALQQLYELLEYLDKHKPEQSLKHRLLLMRTSPIPMADEELNYRQLLQGTFRDSSLRDLVKSQLSKMRRPINDFPEPGSSELDFDTTFYMRFSKTLADFCVSRLRLRKGEKAINGKYEQSQCVEQSSLWRQGYLKALSEIGLDLGGQVHKTVNFVKENDPDPDVRATAKETYKSVRRQSSTTPTRVDFARGIIAAEWWLMLCQRQALALDIDHKAALNTRRKLLRHP